MKSIIACLIVLFLGTALGLCVPPAIHTTVYGITAPAGTFVSMYQRSTNPIPTPTINVQFSEWCLHDNGNITICQEGVCDDCWPRVEGFYTTKGQSIHGEQGDLLYAGFVFSDNTQAFAVYAGPADCNFDGYINSQDYFDFLITWDNGDGDMDFNQDGATDSQDLYDFLTAFFG